MLRAATRQPIKFVSSVFGSTLATGGITSVTFSGHQVGDLLIAGGGGQRTTDPTFTAGWTKINSYQSPSNSARVGIIVYKFATTTANETITFTSTGSSTAVYSGGITFRNVSAIGANTTKTAYSGNAVSSIAVPTLTMNNTSGKSAVIVATYIFSATNISACTGCSIGSGFAYELGATSFTGRTATVNNIQSICGVVELLN